MKAPYDVQGPVVKFPEAKINGFYWLFVTQKNFSARWIVAQLTLFKEWEYFMDPSDTNHFELVFPAYESETLKLPKAVLNVCWVVGLTLIPVDLIKRVVGPLEEPSSVSPCLRGEKERA